MSSSEAVLHSRVAGDEVKVRSRRTDREQDVLPACLKVRALSRRDEVLHFLLEPSILHSIDRKFQRTPNDALERRSRARCGVPRRRSFQ